MQDPIKEYKAKLIADYTALLEEWHEVMKAGDFDRGAILFKAIRSYQTELGL